MRTGRKVEFEREALVGTNRKLRQFIATAYNGHFCRARCHEYLRHATSRRFPRMRNRDCILISNDQQHRRKRRYRNNRLQPAQPSATCGKSFFRELVRLLLAQHFARSIRKSGQCLDVDRALRAIEVVLFVLVPLDLGEFSEHILYCRLQLYSVAMVHLCHPKGSAEGQ